jgi:hypothetical protein
MERNLPSNTYARGGEITSRGEGAFGLGLSLKQVSVEIGPPDALPFLIQSGRHNHRAPL